MWGSFKHDAWNSETKMWSIFVLGNYVLKQISLAISAIWRVVTVVRAGFKWAAIDIQSVHNLIVRLYHLLHNVLELFTTLYSIGRAEQLDEDRTNDEIWKNEETGIPSWFYNVDGRDYRHTFTQLWLRGIKHLSETPSHAKALFRFLIPNESHVGITHFCLSIPLIFSFFPLARDVAPNGVALFSRRFRGFRRCLPCKRLRVVR